MKKLLFLALLVASTTTALVSCQQQDEERLTDYVNPFIGTGGHGHVFLGANVPFGFVQLGPTEPNQGWDWCSGYHSSDSVLVGFGHLHLSGTGIGDLGDIAFLPVSSPQQQYSLFTHADESVRPGYYSIQMHNPDVLVELTATQRTGFQRYTFGSAVEQPLVRVDLKQGIGWDHVAESALQLENPTTLSGFRRSEGWARNQYVFFVAEFSVPVTLQEQQGDTVAILAVSDATKPLLIKCGLSASSVEDARQNLAAEQPAWDFDGTVKAADKAWNAELSKVRIKTTDADARTIFYTALYHSMIAPSVFSDVSGNYRGADGQVHQGDFTNYTTLSLWDTYRSAHPLMTLIHPEKQADIAQTFLHIFEQQGKLPVWHLMGNETDCMVGNPGVPVLADLVLKGYISDPAEAQQALLAMKTSAMLDERGMSLLKQYGYLPWDQENEAVAKGLEYALADDAIARVAKQLGAQEDYEYFFNRSRSYRHYFDPQLQFMRGIDAEGRWHEPFSPFSASHRQDDYTEGNGWQYTWLVPHDVHGLVELFGSEESFINKLDSLFIVTGDMGEEASPDISGLIGQYAHGNEPSHHILYMYNYVGQPWKTAQLVRRTLNELYFNDFDGLSGNEDVGQMSAWYILSALGLYQVEPAGGKYIIGTPIFDEATVRVKDGKTFTIKTVNNSAENIYVQSATLNGQPYEKSYILFPDIIAGGTLELQMGNQPSDWGTAAEARP
ncbi:MAG: GH92 family glycosyl hydrolase [Bacteroidaceae bacterium]|nr:GH92 family glycosyl hydrolase [Bacteroidaceae bacterium]